ncbi:EthD domain-containing protein [Nocardioides caeni]|uniref:Uncharacterized protein n=1 Tax=Nocardioides caeni TaxID=574700 RepID=A0A4S8NPZ9_9ACTN|nr:EthD domain-containing protein [Nocardioides caeni]THV18481.1 hypothetical protein E9934_02335 [Nocardioides caeni]
MKLIAALRSPASGSALLSADFRTALAATGARRLQVNVDDTDVAPAMRFGPGAPITAVVSVWGDDAAAALSVVRRQDAGADAWLVEERLPLPPPPVADGARTDALANVAFLRRPATMSPDEWRADWLDRHTQVAIDTQGTFGYVQNPVVHCLTTGGSDVAGIVEELFMMAAMSDHHAFYGSNGDEEEFQRRFTALMDSCARFGASEGLDLVPSSRYCFDLTGTA